MCVFFFKESRSGRSRSNYKLSARTSDRLHQAIPQLGHQHTVQAPAQKSAQSLCLSVASIRRDMAVYHSRLSGR